MMGEEEGIKIIKRRYANGEITKKQYLEMKANLNNGNETASNRDVEKQKATKTTQSIFRARNIALGFVLLLIILYIVDEAVYVNNNSEVVLSPRNVSQTLFAQGPVSFQFGQTTSQCKPSPCVSVYWSNFTVPANATEIHITGTYSSQYPIVLALLTRTQFTNFMHVNVSKIFSNNEYIVYNKSATINVQLVPGAYSLTFYYPGNPVDSLTITSPITLGYTESPNITTTKSLFDGAVFYNGTVPQPVIFNYTQSNGSKIPLYAVPGWVVISVSPFTSTDTVNSTVLKYDGTLIAYLPSAGLYLASSGTQNESTFINNVKATGVALSVEPDFVDARASAIATVYDPFHSDSNLTQLQNAIAASPSDVITVIVDSFQNAGSHGYDVAGAMDAATNSQLQYIEVQDSSSSRVADQFSSKVTILSIIDAAQEANKKVVISFSTYGVCVGPNGFNDCSNSEKADAWLDEVAGLAGALQDNDWFIGGNVMINKAAGNSAANLSSAFSAIQTDTSLGKAVQNAFQFCGMLSSDGLSLSNVTDWGSSAGVSKTPLGVMFTTPAGRIPGTIYDTYTSLAAPVCSADAAILWGKYPTLSNAQVIQALRQGATAGPGGVPTLNLNNSLVIAAGMVQNQTTSSTTISYNITNSTTSILQNNTGLQTGIYSGILNISATQAGLHQRTSIKILLSFTNFMVGTYTAESGGDSETGSANATYQYTCDWVNGTHPSYVNPHSSYSGTFSDQDGLTTGSQGVYFILGSESSVSWPNYYFSTYSTQDCGGTEAHTLTSEVIEDIFSTTWGNTNGRLVVNDTSGRPVVWLNPNGETVQLSRTFPTLPFQSSTPPTSYTGTFTLTKIR